MNKENGMSWYIAAKRPAWRRVETETPLTYANPDTGEIREHGGGFAGLVCDRDEGWELLGRIAEALGPDVVKRWEDGGPERADLGAEVRDLAESGRRRRRLLEEQEAELERQEAAVNRLRAELAAAQGVAAGYRQVVAAGISGGTGDMVVALAATMDPADVVKGIIGACEMNPAGLGELAATLNEFEFERRRVVAEDGDDDGCAADAETGR